MTTSDIFLFVSHVSEDRSDAEDTVAAKSRHSRARDFAFKQCFFHRELNCRAPPYPAAHATSLILASPAGAARGLID
jgi:hypothetical protein